MTGYSFREFLNEEVHISTEIKTVNSRFLDFNINLPSYMNAMEIEIRNLIKNKLFRGKVEISIYFKFLKNLNEINANLEVTSKYVECLQSIIENFNLRDDVKLFHLTRFEDVIQIEKNKDYSRYWDKIFDSLSENIAEILDMRRKEGNAIKEDLLNISSSIKENIIQIEKNTPCMEKDIYNNMKEKIEELIGNNTDEVKLLNEVAFMVNRSCINEEIQRLKAHVKQFLEILEDNGSIGKKLDFVCQEMHREINTVGSKITLIDLTSNVITIKNDIEKMREQIRNIE